MSDLEPESHTERRSSRRETRSTPRAVSAPERRPNPLARSRDPFDDLSFTVGTRRLDRRMRSEAKTHAIAPLTPLWEERVELDAPSPRIDDERDALLAELIASTPAYRRAPLRRPTYQPSFPWLLLAVCIVSIVILYFFWHDADPSRICLAPGCTTRSQTMLAQMIARDPAPLPPPGQHSVLGPPSISAQQIDRILMEWQSPAAGTGATWVELGIRYGIDPAYALAFFIHESGAGTAPGWAGRKPDGSTTHNVGNIICAGYRTCYGRFRDYASWEEGIEDWYRLIAVEYVQWRGLHTVEEIVPIYAPAIENNVPAYVDTVNRLVAEWRASRARS